MLLNLQPKIMTVSNLMLIVIIFIRMVFGMIILKKHSLLNLIALTHQFLRSMNLKKKKLLKF